MAGALPAAPPPRAGGRALPLRAAGWCAATPWVVHDESCALYESPLDFIVAARDEFKVLMALCKDPDLEVAAAVTVFILAGRLA